MFEFNFGWIFRIIHINFVRFFFVIIFFHFLKGFFHFRFNLKEVWNLGILILLFLIIESFLGYVLIWSQIRFWACTVITSLLIIIPFFGEILLLWIWRNFFISVLTLKIFFLLHFILPLVLIFIIIFHLIFLHNYYRRRKIIFYNKFDKILFFPFYWLKDFYNIIFIILFFVLILFKPFIFNDSEIFLESNRIISPVHIVPEWYFLFAYDILRRILNKKLGVLILLFRILIFFLFTLKNQNKNFKINKILVWVFIFNIFVLRYLGSCFVEDPFVCRGIIISLIYFKIILLQIFINFL